MDELLQSDPQVDGFVVEILRKQLKLVAAWSGGFGEIDRAEVACGNRTERGRQPADAQQQLQPKGSGPREAGGGPYGRAFTAHGAGQFGVVCWAGAGDKFGLISVA